MTCASRRVLATRPLRRWAGATLVLAIAAGCAGYGQRMAAVEAEVAAGRGEAALDALEVTGMQRDRLLYELNRGMILHLTGAYRDSIEAFERAKDRMRDLEAISVSATAASVTISERAGDYTGALHDRLFLYVYQMLNRLALDDLEGALVEARQMDLELRRLDSEGRAPFGIEAFPRYLSGIVFEAAGQRSDAMIAYRKAWQAYTRPDAVSGPTPRSLEESLVRMAHRQGLDAELADYRARFGVPTDEVPGPSPDEGELVLVFHAGLAPVKREHSVLAQDPGSGRLYRMSLPHYVSRSRGIDGAVLRVGQRRVPTEPVADIDRIARRLLERRIPAMTARALGRNVVKGVAAREVGEHSQGLALLLNLVGVISEQADTRSWRTLPDNLQLARVALPAGRYDVSVRTSGAGGALAGYPDTEVPAGGKRFLLAHRLAH